MDNTVDIQRLRSKLEDRAKDSSLLHELINTILDHLPFGVYVKDVANGYRYLYWNRFMEELTGVMTADIEDHNDFEVHYNGILTPQERCEKDRYIVQTGKTVEEQGCIQTAAGEYKVMEVTKFPITLQNGSRMLIGLWRDVTTKLEMERVMKRSITLNQMALRMSDVRTCSILVNPDSVLDYTDAVVMLNDWSSLNGNTISISWSAFLARVHPDDVTVYNEHFLRLCRGEVNEVKMEVRLKFPKSDNYMWRSGLIYVFERDAMGRPITLLGCSSDIQSQKEQEIDREQALQKAEAADKMKSKYLADMSHEIRTPLNAITGFSELMVFTDSEEERLAYYDVVKTNNQLLMQLMNDILDLSKIEADAMQIHYAKVELNELMDATYASAKLRLVGDVNLVLEKERDDCPFVTDQIRLLQLLNNFINNAIKNTKQGTITIGYRCLPDESIEFYVKDTGIGIASDKLESLFTRFVKLNDYVEGIGLGLAICQGLVTKMDGTIHVDSQLGVGSCFSCILPAHTLPSI